MENLKRTMECVICLENVSTPRMCSNCSILFCQACIDKWVATVNKPNCPHCLNDAVDFLVDIPWMTILLKELEQRVEKMPTSTNNNGGTHVCQKEIFCIECKRAICFVCAKLEHAEHQFKVYVAGKKQPGAKVNPRVKLQAQIESITATIVQLSTHLESTKEELNELENNLEQCDLGDLERKLKKINLQVSKMVHPRKKTK